MKNSRDRNDDSAWGPLPAVLVIVLVLIPLYLSALIYVAGRLS